MEAALLRLEAEGQILRGRFTASATAQGSEIEWCNRRVLARIHRMTLGRLRREIEPVNARDFMRFLYHWQHVKPGTQLHGPDGALHVIKQLQGYEVSAAAWEGDVLRRRVGKYAPELLDQLCISGEVVWGRLSPHPAFDDQERGKARPPDACVRRGRRPLRCFCERMRRGCSKRPRAPRPSTTARSRARPADAAGCPALRVRCSSRSSRRGASFLADVVKDTRQLTSVVEDALWELAAAGLVTADGFENLRALIDPKRRLATAKHPSRASALRPRPLGAAFRLRSHMSAELQRDSLLRPPRLSVRSDSDSRIHCRQTLEAVARQLLLRWGVVFRDLVARETITPPWRDLLITFRRMEAQGEIRGGRFVSGFVGEQFARPEAVELLREVRRDQNVGAAPHVSARRSVESRRHHHARAPASARSRAPASRCGRNRRLTIRWGQTPFLRIS